MADWQQNSDHQHKFLKTSFLRDMNKEYRIIYIYIYKFNFSLMTYEKIF